MKPEDVTAGIVVDVIVDGAVLYRGKVLTPPTVGSLYDSHCSAVQVLEVSDEWASDYPVGSTYSWFVSRFRLALAHCTCDIKVLLWGTQGCTCGWLEVERKNQGVKA